MADLASTPSKSVFKWENHPYLYLDPSIHLSIYLYIYWVILGDFPAKDCLITKW
jgi:hypothetical protein